MCNINLAEFANKNPFYYENQIRISIEGCQDIKASILLTLKLTSLDYNFDGQD